MIFWKKAIATALALVTLSCVGATAAREAKDAEQTGQWDLAVQKYARALQENPENPKYKLSLIRLKLRASQAHFDRGKLHRSAGNPELAIGELQQPVLLDPTNDYAKVELRKAQDDFARLQAERGAETRLERMKRKTRGSRAVTPMLEPASDRPINLNFPQPKPIKLNEQLQTPGTPPVQGSSPHLLLILFQGNERMSQRNSQATSYLTGKVSDERGQPVQGSVVSIYTQCRLRPGYGESGVLYDRSNPAMA